MYKYRRTEESHNIDTTHLLSNHDREGRQACATIPRNREKLHEESRIAFGSDEPGLESELRMDVIKIPTSQESGVSKSTKRLPRIMITFLSTNGVTQGKRTRQ